MFNRHRGSLCGHIACLICAGAVALTGMAAPASGNDEVPFAEHKGSKVAPDAAKRHMVRTGAVCSVQVHFSDQNTAMVRSTLWADVDTEFHAARRVKPDDDVYRADLPQGRVAVLQVRGGWPVKLTYSTTNGNGAGNGATSATGNMITECDLSRRGRRLARKQDANKKPSDFNARAFSVVVVLGYYFFLGRGLRG